MTYTAHEVLGGIYENTVKMTVDRRLQNAPYAQAGWIESEQICCSGRVRSVKHKMYSYSSLVLTVYENYNTATGELVQILVNTANADAATNCSRTTSKQVTNALREFFPSALVYEIKEALISTGLYDWRA